MERTIEKIDARLRIRVLALSLVPGVKERLTTPGTSARARTRIRTRELDAPHE